jgi:hypothetical protein
MGPFELADRALASEATTCTALRSERTVFMPSRVSFAMRARQGCDAGRRGVLVDVFEDQHACDRYDREDRHERHSKRSLGVRLQPRLRAHAERCARGRRRT